MGVALSPHRALDLLRGQGQRDPQGADQCRHHAPDEIDLLRLGREMDMVTIGLAFDERTAFAWLGGAARYLCFHAGTTKGGLRGYDLGRDDR